MNILKYITVLIILSTLISCQSDHLYLYEVNPVEVKKDGVKKQNLKSDLEFLSLAYTDLFGQTLPDALLNRMVGAYASVGDKSLIADIIIRNLLNRPEAQIPDNTDMRADVKGFVIGTYKKFYVREPGEYERWYFENLINSNPDITPEIIYYAFLTSDEYRYY